MDMANETAKSDAIVNLGVSSSASISAGVRGLPKSMDWASASVSSEGECGIHYSELEHMKKRY
jgi:hypothetical protein